MTLEERFTNSVHKTEECWVWNGPRYRSYGRGYTVIPFGYLMINGKKELAHRIAYELYVSKIPAGKLVFHTCKNSACVNPEHLFFHVLIKSAILTWYKLQVPEYKVLPVDVRTLTFKEK